MALEVILPRVDMDMSEGKIAHWYVKNGDAVSKGQLVFEIETDKATMEIDAAADGVIQGIDGAVGVTLPVGHIVAWILKPGEELPDAAKPVAEAADQNLKEKEAEALIPIRVSAIDSIANQVADVPARSATPQPLAETPDQAVRKLLRATPLARSLSRTHGIDLQNVEGSGPNGSVLASDIAGLVAREAIATATQGDLNLHWYARHEGAPLVLLHGFGTSRGSWRPLADQLTGLPVAALDLPNHGKSPLSNLHTFAAIAAAVKARLDREGIDALHLVGHSLGGGVALALAGLLGKRLKSLTLLAPAGLGPDINGAFIEGILRASREESLRPWLGKLFGDAARLTSSFSASAWQELASPERRAALATMAGQMLPDGTQAESLRSVMNDLYDVPLKVIWGTLDRVIPVGHAAGLPGHAALHTLAGVGHLPQVEAAALVARLLRQQLGAGSVA